MAQYNEYKDSGQQWLGKVPSHWKVESMKHCFSVQSIKGHPELPQLCSTQKYGVIPQSLYENRVVSALKGLETLKVVSIGDFVISLRSFQGGIEYAYYEGIISPAYTILKPRNRHNSEYFKYLLKCQCFISLLQSMVTGIREGQNIDYDKLKYEYIPIPPADEQAGIVAYLDKVTADIDKAIAAKERIISALEERRKIIITEAVTRGINPDAPLRDSGIDWLGQIPAHWEVVPLKTICKFGQSLNITKADLVAEGFPVINYGQVHSKFNSRTALSDELIRYVPQFYADNSPNCLCGKNDFIVADTSEDLDGCGNMVFIDKDIDVLAGYHTYSLKEVEVYNPKFLAYQMASNTWRFQIRKNVNAVKVYTISKSILKQSLIWIPSDIEQDVIVNKLDKETGQIDCILIKLKEAIDLLRERKAIIINEVVTGKVKVV